MKQFKFHRKASIQWQLIDKSCQFKLKRYKNEVVTTTYSVENIRPSKELVGYNDDTIGVSFMGVTTYHYNNGESVDYKEEFYEEYTVSPNTTTSQRTIPMTSFWVIDDNNQVEFNWSYDQEAMPTPTIRTALYGVIPYSISHLGEGSAITSITNSMIKDAMKINYISSLEAISPIDIVSTYLTLEDYSWVIALIKQSYNYNVTYMDDFGEEEELPFTGSDTIIIDGEEYKMYGKLVKYANEIGKLNIKQI